jgi:hypothetical protein
VYSFDCKASQEADWKYFYVTCGLTNFRASTSGGRDASTSTQAEGDGAGQRASIHTDEHEQLGDGAEPSGQARVGGRDASQALRLETVLGKEHPSTLTSMDNLAMVLKGQAKYERAEGMLRQAPRLRERMLGKEYPDTLRSMIYLAMVLKEQAEEMLQ